MPDDTLTPTARRVLQFLSSQQYATPSTIGELLSKRRRPKQQGLGRVGGGYCARLAKRGLVESASRLRDGFPAWRITKTGLRALVLDTERLEGADHA